MQINEIRHENCLDTIKIMDNEFVDIVVTSPPYDEMREYEGYKLKDSISMLKRAIRWLKGTLLSIFLN